MPVCSLPRQFEDPSELVRPRLVGQRLPKLQLLLQSQRTSWTKRTVIHCYGSIAREVEYVSGTAICYHGGFQPLPIRWVLISRSALQLCSSGAAVYRSRATPPSDSGLVCPTLAGRGDLPGS